MLIFLHQTRIAELSSAGPFPPELLDDKNAEIEELRQQLLKTEVWGHFNCMTGLMHGALLL